MDNKNTYQLGDSVSVYINLKIILYSQQIVKLGNTYDDEKLLQMLRPDI